MDLTEEEVYHFSRSPGVYGSLIVSMPCFTLPKKKFAADVIIVRFKALLFNPRNEEDDLTTARRTKHPFRDCFISSEAPVPREPRTSILLSDFYFGKVEHSRKLTNARRTCKRLCIGFFYPGRCSGY